MKKNVIAGIDKILNSSTSELSNEDRLELEKIRELVGRAKTKEDLTEMAKQLFKILGMGMELLM